MIKRDKRFQPAQFLAISFIATIAFGTFLLLLPFCTYSGHISFLDALFTSTSAVCVTGLIVQDTATYFTPAGQMVILLLFQLGGLGIMTFSTLILLMAGKSVSIKDRIIIQEDFHHSKQKNVKSLIKNIFLFTFSVELLGSILLFVRWHGKLPGKRAAFVSVFHSVSAFCNAGFSVFSDSLKSYSSDTWINLTIILLIILGGLGFLVHLESREILSGIFSRKKIKVSLHTKLVLIMTGILIFSSWGIFLLLEWNSSLQGLAVKEKIIMGLFQTVTPRTAGFNTMDLGTLSFASIYLLMALMFIGASPGSTSGGVKTSTIGVIGAFIKSKLAARDSVLLLRRTLPTELIIKAFTLVSLSVCLIGLSSFLLFLVQPDANMKNVFFEVLSAFGTVGLSLGLTPKLTAMGKIVIILTMYIGRIGLLTLLIAFSRRKAFGRYEYAEESVMIG